MSDISKALAMILARIKRAWINTYAVLLGLIAMIVALVFYYDNIGNVDSYWYQSGNSYVNIMSILALVIFIIVLCGVAGANWFDEKGNKLWANIFKGVSAALEIIAVCFVWTALLTLVNVRVEGMGFVLGSDATVAGEVARFVPSVNRLIVDFVFYGIAGVIPMIGLFFNFYREKKEPAGETQGA